MERPYGEAAPESGKNKSQGKGASPRKRKAAQGKTISGNMTLGADGKYRWVYEMSLLKNPTIFLLVWKILFFIFLGQFLLLMLLDGRRNNFFWDGFLSDAKAFGYCILGMTVVLALGYLVYAAMMGGAYIVAFEMDENGVNHKQIDAQAKKAKKLGRAAMLGGLAAGRLTTVGAGMNAQRTQMYSDFSKTKKVKAYPRRHLIKVNGPLSHNQVYASKEDFAFVEHFIVSHCPHIKKQRGE